MQSTRQPTECTNCGTETEPLVYLENEWNFWACPVCAEWCAAVEQTENTCPDLFGQVIEARSTAEVRQAMQAHAGAECVHCGSSRKTVATDRLYVDPQAVCCERKEIA